MQKNRLKIQRHPRICKRSKVIDIIYQ
jgi:hypothetical protein